MQVKTVYFPRSLSGCMYSGLCLQVKTMLDSLTDLPLDLWSCTIFVLSSGHYPSGPWGLWESVHQPQWLCHLHSHERENLLFVHPPRSFTTGHPRSRDKASREQPQSALPSVVMSPWWTIRFLPLECRLSKTFLILRRIQRDIVINMKTSSCKVPVILVGF